MGQILDSGRGGRGQQLYRSVGSRTEGLPGRLKSFLQPEQFAQGLGLPGTFVEKPSWAFVEIQGQP